MKTKIRIVPRKTTYLDANGVKKTDIEIFYDDILEKPYLSVLTSEGHSVASIDYYKASKPIKEHDLIYVERFIKPYKKENEIWEIGKKLTNFYNDNFYNDINTKEFKPKTKKETYIFKMKRRDLGDRVKYTNLTVLSFYLLDITGINFNEDILELRNHFTNVAFIDSSFFDTVKSSCKNAELIINALKINKIKFLIDDLEQ